MSFFDSLAKGVDKDLAAAMDDWATPSHPANRDRRDRLKDWLQPGSGGGGGSSSGEAAEPGSERVLATLLHVHNDSSVDGGRWALDIPSLELQPLARSWVNATARRGAREAARSAVADDSADTATSATDADDHLEVRAAATHGPHHLPRLLPRQSAAAAARA